MTIKKWSLGLLFFIGAVLWFCSIIFPIVDIFCARDHERTVIGRWYDHVVDKIPAEIRIIEKPAHYIIQIKYFFFWEHSNCIDKNVDNRSLIAREFLDKNGNYSVIKELRYEYNRTLNLQKRALPGRVFTIPEQTELFKAINGEDDA